MSTITQARPPIPYRFPCRKKATTPSPRIFSAGCVVSCLRVCAMSHYTVVSNKDSRYDNRYPRPRLHTAKPGPVFSNYLCLDIADFIIGSGRLFHSRPLPFLEIGCDPTKQSRVFALRSVRLHCTAVCRITPQVICMQSSHNSTCHTTTLDTMPS